MDVFRSGGLDPWSDRSSDLRERKNIWRLTHYCSHDLYSTLRAGCECRDGVEYIDFVCRGDQGRGIRRYLRDGVDGGGETSPSPVPSALAIVSSVGWSIVVMAGDLTRRQRDKKIQVYLFL